MPCVGFEHTIPAFEDSSCLRPRGHCDRLVIPLSFINEVQRQCCFYGMMLIQSFMKIRQLVKKSEGDQAMYWHMSSVILPLLSGCSGSTRSTSLVARSRMNRGSAKTNRKDICQRWTQTCFPIYMQMTNQPERYSTLENKPGKITVSYISQRYYVIIYISL
jgi:hypothetical protein